MGTLQRANGSRLSTKSHWIPSDGNNERRRVEKCWLAGEENCRALVDENTVCSEADYYDTAASTGSAYDSVLTFSSSCPMDKPYDFDSCPSFGSHLTEHAHLALSEKMDEGSSRDSFSSGASTSDEEHHFQFTLCRRNPLRHIYGLGLRDDTSRASTRGKCRTSSPLAGV